MNTFSKIVSDVSTKDLAAAHKAIKTATKLLNKGWCRGHSAIDKDGKTVAFNSRKADRFCAAGSLDRAAFNLSRGKARETLITLTRNILGSSDVLSPSKACSIINFNDGYAHDKREVVRKFTKAANLVKQELDNR